MLVSARAPKCSRRCRQGGSKVGMLSFPIQTAGAFQTPIRLPENDFLYTSDEFGTAIRHALGNNLFREATEQVIDAQEARQDNSISARSKTCGVSFSCSVENNLNQKLK